MSILKGVIGKRATHIVLKGVRQNNLKGFDVTFPLGKMTVVTGLSGTGKSSLVFETLHAEGQRRYVETFSAYTRQFLDLLDKPNLDDAENIRPSIAIQQSNTVKTSRSTVGTMTELCDYFKVWFNHVSDCFDPETGEWVVDDHPERVWSRISEKHSGLSVLLMFPIRRPGKLSWEEVTGSLLAQGYSRVLHEGSVLRLESLDPASLDASELLVVQDRLKVEPSQRGRFTEAVGVAQHYGSGAVEVWSEDIKLLGRFTRGLHSPSTGRTFRDKTPALFSFNSPIGACPRCRGFGRIIEIDYDLVIPDKRLSIKDGAIRAFQGDVYQESLNDLMRACRKRGIPTHVAWESLNEDQLEFIMEGHPGYQTGDFDRHGHWYGVKRFFAFLEQSTYKMHVRVFLSKYRSYVRCPDCQGTRLQPEALCWKWKDYRLPDLYQLAVKDLYSLIKKESVPVGNEQVDAAREAILNRLSYLIDVGLGYLNLDRSSRSLSGGEVERVNLTACLGTKLTDTLFVLDEPSVGLHARDIQRLIRILRMLTDLGNTVVLVEHDESVMRAADHLIEIGPEPGRKGGSIVFEGTPAAITVDAHSITGAYLSGRRSSPLAEGRREVALSPFPLVADADAQELAPYQTIRIEGASKHNIRDLSLVIPLDRLVCLTGVSGSGKSTLLNHVLHQGILQKKGQVVEDPARVEHLEVPEDLDVILVDQSAISRTPRSNPALFVNAWDAIRKLFAGVDEARASGFTHSDFSFNAGSGRCDHCNGLGYERVEMQFLSDVFVRCPVCEGKRFKPEVLEVKWKGCSVSDVLEMDVRSAMEFFQGERQITASLAVLDEVGLGYLQMGQPLNTLSGGESQRLKLVRYLSKLDKDTGRTLLLLDEPTTGLHRDDVMTLIRILQRIVDQGHSLIVIEHHLDVIKAADWIVEMGPDAGSDGGRLTAAGTPLHITKTGTETARFLADVLEQELDGPSSNLMVAEPASPVYGNALSLPEGHSNNGIEILGAREHNLKNINVSIPSRAITVVTGVSGSGKSTLAFDIVFAEGQRRYMESMSAYARQFVEQLPRPDIDDLRGLSPTVAIEQRVTRGSRKSTVATITEVAQYLRLLYARIGVQHSPVSGKPVTAQPLSVVQSSALRKARSWLGKHSGRAKLHLCSPVVRGRKGHHEPLANWARERGFKWLRCDGQWVKIEAFKKLNRYQEHDIELVVDTLEPGASDAELRHFGSLVKAANHLGKGTFFLLDSRNVNQGTFSTTRVDPDTGLSYPALDPKHFSWNSPRGWCPCCRGYGRIYASDYEEEGLPRHLAGIPDGSICPECQGDRLNAVSRSVRLHAAEGRTYSLPELLRLDPVSLLEVLRSLPLDERGKAIMTDIYPQIEERLRFMDRVGVEYLALDRETATLSGGEAQRIRLASQLGTNLTGVLYVLDEPSIGLHPQDNERLIQSLEYLRDKGNTLLVVEHDEETMRRADHIIDLGPGAGVHGGSVTAQGHAQTIVSCEASLTGRYLREGIAHPLRGAYRALPSGNPFSSKPPTGWLVLRSANLRNLQGDDLAIPLGRLTMVCGVSGAGKSTLIRDLLMSLVEYAGKNELSKLEARTAKAEGLFLETKGPRLKDYPFRTLINGNAFHRVIEMDQSPIGKTPRSNPATYIGIFDTIRQLFATTPDAKMRGYEASHFSFNTGAGRCEACKGAGRIKLEMGFMPDTYIHCEACEGTRYRKEVRDVLWNGKSIVDVLRMTFEDAREFFSFHSMLSSVMELMVETGLGYLRLGQSSPTLSGGEAQRIKLVNELTKGLQSYKDRTQGIQRRNLYILEEPTIGLHQGDCERLILLLHKLVDQGHTVVVIEHHLDLLAEADYLVEVGPGSGGSGGRLLYQGNMEGFLVQKNSPTARFLNSNAANGKSLSPSFL